MELSIQIVNYNSRHCLRGCLISLSEYLSRNKETEIIVINNDSEPLEGYLKKNFPGWPLTVVETNKNLGFGKAHNKGFEMARGEYVLFLNPDTKVLSGALEGLTRALKSNEAGIAGPRLVDGNGLSKEEHCGTRKTPFSIIKSKFMDGRNYCQMEGLSEVDWISGGAMMLRKDTFRQLGGFDEKYFMYFEDVDLCLQARKKGYRVIVNSLSKVHHQGGQSFSGVRDKKRYYYTSQDYYLRKNFGPVRAGLIKLLRLPYYIINVWLER